MTGTFVDNVGATLTQTEGPVYAPSLNGFIFGAVSSGGAYKMVLVNINQVNVESRAMSSSKALSVANWNAATIPGAYSVTNIVITGCDPGDPANKN